MSPITELKHLFTGSPSAGDRRWASYPPLRPLRGIIVLALLLIIIQASGWISFTVAARGHYYEYLDFTSLLYIVIAFMFIISAGIDLLLFFRHHLRPVYAVSMATIWTTGWLVSATIACLLAWIYIGDPWSTEYVDNPETKPGGVWKLQGVTVLEVIISIVMIALYVWYLVLAVKVFRLEKKMKRESISLPELDKA